MGDASKVCDVVYFKKVNLATGKKEAAFSWTLGEAWRAKGPISQRHIESANCQGRLGGATALEVRYRP
jgi:hypothetical protein